MTPQSPFCDPKSFKMLFSASLVLTALFALLLVPAAHADTIATTEYQVSSGPAFETTPTLGQDLVSNMVGGLVHWQGATQGKG